MKHSPLSSDQLRMIQTRNIINTDAMTLLREIKRLHGILNNCWQVFDGLPAPTVNSPLGHLIKVVNNEPCVKEQREAYESVGQGKMSEK